MEKSVAYSTKDWDDVADVPLLHVSYLIQILLPRRHFGHDRLQMEKQKILEGFSNVKDGLSGKLHIVPVGSKSEGYGIPDAVRLTDQPYIEYMSDIDAMLVREEFSASANEFEKDGTRNPVVIETSHTHPGYGRVRFSSPTDITSKVLYHDGQTDKYYLNSSMIMDEQIKMMETSTDDPVPMTQERGKQSKLFHPQDYVFAIPCNSWPECALPWTKRRRTNGWLAADIVDSIVSTGIHMVPVAHRLSCNPDIEWRLSFAKAEQILAEQAITSAQRQCYVYLKILRKQTMEENTKLSSYFLKNVFLYCCDELPVRVWDDDPAGCVLYMLDVLLECVQKRNIPNYFLPENNMVDYLDESELQSIESALQTIRSDPIEPILEFTDLRIFCYAQECLSYSTTFRSIVQIVLDEIASVEDVDIGRTVLGCFTDIQCNIASVMLGEKRTSFSYHLDFYQLFVQKYIQMSFVDFVNYMGIRLETPFITLMFYEKCLAEVQNFPELEYLRGNMACMCFALAQSHDDKSKERKMRLYQAEKLYNEVLQNNGIHFASTIDFANFLCDSERWEEAISLLEKFIEAERKRPSSMQNGYYPAESTTLNVQLQREVKYTGCFLASSLSFAYYFIIKATIATQLKNLPDILEKFEKHCRSVNSYGDYELLGYCGLDTENYVLAELAFSKAANLHQNNLLAQVNLNLCRANSQPAKKQHRIVNLIIVFKYCLSIGYLLNDNVFKATNLLFERG
ncbi:Hypothetical predicted protein [Mytilus galloprovincialis]|uniref:Mab-21-like HhH/H2TH-like domain-containing protein n=1 Tax=Mytilus galloprovincialis TaxID=29158 RepID=A0A8B6G8S9_MYTGA|nr:Hypothetical predicted protein [Mytilus galloprovincialis]